MKNTNSVLKQLIKDKYFVLISVLIYLLYPYLFGHAQFNPKDIPFLSVWVICTYFIIKMEGVKLKEILEKRNQILNNKVKNKKISFLGVTVLGVAL